jgi:CheY-like chemotaxis protein
MNLSGQTILIADDNSDDRFFIKRALSRVASGISVQCVVSGQEAIAYLNGTGAYADRLHFPYPSFVITDCEMPNGDGFSVLRRLQGSTSTPMRVMMLSSSEDPEHSRRAHGLGASSYCIKPHDPKALVPIVSKFLDPPARETVNRSTPMALGVTRI